MYQIKGKKVYLVNWVLWIAKQWNKKYWVLPPHRRQLLYAVSKLFIHSAEDGQF